VTRGAIDLYSSGRKVGEVRLPFSVRNLAPVWIFLGLAGLFLVLSPVLEVLEKNLEEPSLLGTLTGAIGGPVAAGIFLSILAFVAGASWLLWASPAETRPVTVSLSKPANE
jgi:hypothetical protein